MNKKHGLILINAYALGSSARQTERIASELSARGVSTEILRNNFFPLEISGGNLLSRLDCDFCVYLDKDKYVAAMLEKQGVRLFNRAKAIALCDDKMLTHIALADSGISMPDTLPGLLCYDKSANIDKAALDFIEKRLGYPLVIKQSYGSFGKGVFKADDRAALEKIADSVKFEPHLFQQYLASSHGKDMRVIVVGGRVLGGILRKSNGDFRSNIGLGGSATKTDVPKDVCALAVKTSERLGLDYCGIDFLLGENGALVCEVNSNALFDAFEQATDINVAAAYADHIISQVYG